jgi:hypothetical protein
MVSMVPGEMFQTLMTNKKQGKMRQWDVTDIIHPNWLSSNRNKYF